MNPHIGLEIPKEGYMTLGGQINHNFVCNGRESALFHCDSSRNTVTTTDVGIECSPGKLIIEIIILVCDYVHKKLKFNVFKMIVRIFIIPWLVIKIALII